VVDGQHTAIAAATIGVPSIPVFVVEAETLDERARAFVGHNTDRIVVSPINIYNALRAAGDPDALDVANVCKRAGVTIREFSQSSAIKVGDTKAVGLIRRMIAKRGVIKTRQVLECLVKAKRAPLGGGEILAAEHLICDGAGVSLSQLVAAIRIEGDAGVAKARAKASSERSPLWRAIAARWMARIAR
jgi:NAD(P)H-nitrite reductase large subunit